MQNDKPSIVMTVKLWTIYYYVELALSGIDDQV
jgi:hypothetical protein